MAGNLETRLIRLLHQAIYDYQLISHGDRIILAFSGGKDSFGLFQLLRKAFSNSSSFSPPPRIYPVLIDPGYHAAGWDRGIDRAREYLLQHDSTLLIEKTDIFQQAYLPESTKNPCFLCSRMRRKKLYEIAVRLNCSKIAMAHHKDDITETFLLNIFFSREISTMIPKQMTFGGKFQLIRPMAYIEERLLQQYAWKNCFPTINNPCPEERRSKRKYIKNLLHQLEREDPLVKNNIFHSLKNVKPQFLLKVSGNPDKIS